MRKSKRADQMISTVNKIVSQREVMYDKRLAFRTLAHLVAIGKIKKGMISANPKKPEGVKKIILNSEPELRLIMPGKDSIYHKTLTENLENLIIECNK